MKTIEIHIDRALKIPASQLAFNSHFGSNSERREGEERLPEFPLIGKQTWVKLMPGGEFERVVKTLEWKLGFDLDTYVEDFVNASLTGDVSKLPDLINNASSSKSFTTNTLGYFTAEVLGIRIEEFNSLESLVLEDVGNGWKYDFFSPKSTGRWTNCDIEGRDEEGRKTYGIVYA